MIKPSHPKKLGLLTAAMLTLAAVPTFVWAAPKGRMGKAKKKMPKTTLALAERWSAVFQVPASWLMSIADIESDFDIEMSDDRERAMKRGGAWGLMGLTLHTAASEVERIKKDPAYRGNPLVRRALSYWNGTGQSLWNPDLNMMLGAYYLGRMRRVFGNEFKTTAAAYHQGPGTVRQLIDRGMPIPEMMKPYGKQYVLSAIEAHRRYL